MAYVYMHLRLDTQKPFYIGVGADTGGYYTRANDVWGRNDIWNKIIKKTAYEVGILVDGITYEEALKREVEVIAFYGKIKFGGLLANITDGGMGCVGLAHSEGTKQKLRDAKTGLPSKKKGKPSGYGGALHGMFGKTHSDELKAKWSLTRRGFVPWNKGVKMPNSHLIELNKARSIVVFQYDLNGVLLNTYPSMNEAARVTGIKKGNIWHCCKGNRISTCGFKWASEQCVTN